MKYGRDYPVGIRYSAREFIPGSRRLGESVKIARLIKGQDTNTAPVLDEGLRPNASMQLISNTL